MFVFGCKVINFVAEIREVTSPDQWGHCPGKVNSADDASRGLINLQKLSSQHRWWRGPDFPLGNRRLLAKCKL